jgi:hypothetical protein
LKFEIPTDTFVLDRDARGNMVELAYLVTPARFPDAGSPGEVFLRLGILGNDANLQPLPYEGIIGFDEPIMIPFSAGVCDFDFDGVCDVDDLNHLLAALGTENDMFNLDPGNSLINLSDRDAWLAVAQDGTGLEFVTGDTDLDGDVDPADLNHLGLHWQMQRELGWHSGDFNGDNAVNASDLNSLSVNWQHGATLAAVPEPGMTGLLVALIPLWARRRRSISRSCN